MIVYFRRCFDFFGKGLYTGSGLRGNSKSNGSLRVSSKALGSIVRHGPQVSSASGKFGSVSVWNSSPPTPNTVNPDEEHYGSRDALMRR